MQPETQFFTGSDGFWILEESTLVTPYTVPQKRQKTVRRVIVGNIGSTLPLTEILSSCSFLQVGLGQSGSWNRIESTSSWILDYIDQGESMKSKLKKNEYREFSDLLGKVASVPHERLKAALEAEKAAKKKPSKERASDRASSDKD
jgi:hypothetical protein